MHVGRRGATQPWAVSRRCTLPARGRFFQRSPCSHRREGALRESRLKTCRRPEADAWMHARPIEYTRVQTCMPRVALPPGLFRNPRQGSNARFQRSPCARACAADDLLHRRSHHQHRSRGTPQAVHVLWHQAHAEDAGACAGRAHWCARATGHRTVKRGAEGHAKPHGLVPGDSHLGASVPGVRRRIHDSEERRGALGTAPSPTPALATHGPASCSCIDPALVVEAVR